MTAAPDAPPPVILRRLTACERVALLTVAMGLTQVRASRRLGVSERTLRRRITDVVDGLGARSAAHAVALAAASDQLDLEAVRSQALPGWPRPERPEPSERGTCVYPGCGRPRRTSTTGRPPRYCDLTGDDGRRLHTAQNAYYAKNSAAARTTQTTPVGDAPAPSRREVFARKRRKLARLIEQGTPMAEAAAKAGIGLSTAYSWRIEDRRRRVGGRQP